MIKATSVQKYIATAPENARDRLRKIRQAIKQSAPEAEELISYGMPAYKLNGRILLYFAAWEKHIGLYAMPTANAAFKKELEKYKHAKGSVQFPLGRPVPYGLVKKIVKFRAKENLARGIK